MNEQSNTKTIWIIVILIVVAVAGVMIYRSTDMSDNMSGLDTDTMMPSSTDGTSMNNGQNANGSGSNGSNSNSAQGTSQGSTNQVDVIANNAVTLKGMIDNALIRVPSTSIDVALKAGTATYQNGQIKGTVTLGRVLGKTKVEAGYDVFVEMTVASNATVGQKYVALFNLTSTGIKYASAVSIGDRVTLQSLNISDDKNVSPQYSYMNTGMRFASIAYIVSVNYLDRKNGEPATATPSLAKDTAFTVKNHIISK